MNRITPEWAILGVGVLALLVVIPLGVQGFRRRGTGETYESNFWIQRAPQLAVLLNVALLAIGFEESPGAALSLFAYLPDTVASFVEWGGVALYVSGLSFVVGGWYSLGTNFSLDAELLRDQTETNRGFYRLVLHPAYSGVVQALLGAGLASGWIVALAFSVTIVGPLGLRRARHEEALLIERFGEEYERYASSIGWRRIVPAFIPFGF
jgi:protein-S-isoprenylcysteine O-methyltransferase Ste14